MRVIELRLSETRQRRIGLAAVAGGIVGILYFPLHSLAYFATEDSTEGVVKWKGSGRDLLEPLLDWDSADTVYRTWGKVGLLVVLGFALGVLALWLRRRDQMGRLEHWAFRVALVGYSLVLVGFFVEYWTPYLDFGFNAFTEPGMLVTLIGSTLLGIAFLRQSAVPRFAAWLLALSIPLVFGITALLGHLSAGLIPLDLVWILLGLWLWSSAAPRRYIELPLALALVS
ncbi:MAG: hypothetical protein WD015_05960 [Gaiellaceae bacterium]